MAPVIHHIELWTSDLASSLPEFDWLLTALGWQADPVEGWDTGMIWRAPTGVYLVLYESPAISGGLDRTHAGLNHLALTVTDREQLERFRDAAAHGRAQLFADRYPHADGSDSVALDLENTRAEVSSRCGVEGVWSRELKFVVP